MKIFTKLVMDWNGNILESEGYDYSGPTALACGAPAAQKQLAQEQADYYQTLTSNAQAEFGQASALAQQFAAEYDPIFAAGPNQKGWNAEEANAVNANIVTTEGQATANAQRAAGTSTNALGGGNEYVPEGAVRQGKAAINVAGEQATSQSQQNALLADYQQGFQNFTQASSALAGIPNLYAGSTGAAGAATGGGSAANTSLTDIASESMAPLSLVGSALGATGAIFTGKG